MSIHKEMNEQTSRKIKRALLTSMVEVGFNKVTVKQLAQISKINRGTFYLHYKDKFDVMDDLQQELLLQLQQCVFQIDPTEAFHLMRQGQMYTPFLQMFQFLQKHADAFRILLSEQGDPAILLKMQAIYKEHFSRKLPLEIVRIKEPFLADYILAFATSGIIGTIQHWLQSEETVLPVEEIWRLHFLIMQFLSQASSGLLSNKDEK